MSNPIRYFNVGPEEIPEEAYANAAIAAGRVVKWGLRGATLVTAEEALALVAIVQVLGIPPIVPGETIDRDWVAMHMTRVVGRLRSSSRPIATSIRPGRTPCDGLIQNPKAGADPEKTPCPNTASVALGGAVLCPSCAGRAALEILKEGNA